MYLMFLTPQMNIFNKEKKRFASTWLSWLLSEIYDVPLCYNFFSSPLYVQTEPLLDKKNDWIHWEYTPFLLHRSRPHGVWDLPLCEKEEEYSQSTQ